MVALLPCDRLSALMAGSQRRGSVGEVQDGVGALHAGGGEAVGGSARPPARTFLEVLATVLG